MPGKPAATKGAGLHRLAAAFHACCYAVAEMPGHDTCHASRCNTQKECSKHLLVMLLTPNAAVCTLPRLGLSVTYKIV